MARFEVSTEGTVTESQSAAPNTKDTAAPTKVGADSLEKITKDIAEISNRLAEMQSREAGRKWTDSISRWAAYLAFAIFLIGTRQTSQNRKSPSRITSRSNRHGTSTTWANTSILSVQNAQNCRPLEVHEICASKRRRKNRQPESGST